MPTPISPSSTPFVPQPTAAEPPNVVPIPPVYVEGDAHKPNTGVAQLVKAHDAARAPADCRREGANALIGTLPVGGAALATLVAVASGPVGIAAGLLTLFGVSFQEGKDLRAYYNCKSQ